MDLEAVAAELGVHYQTAYRWVRLGFLPAVKVGSEYEVDPAGVAAFAEARSAERRTAGAGTGAAPWIEQLCKALVDGDERSARSLIAALQESGVPPLAVCEGVIVPAIRVIVGQRDGGTLLPADAAAALSLCERLVGLLSFPPRGRPRGTVVVAGPEGGHRLPVLLAMAALRSDRWRVHDLGANVPVADVVEFTADRQPELVVLAAPIGHPGAPDAMAAVEAAVSVPVLWYEADTPLSALLQRAQQLTARPRPSR